MSCFADLDAAGLNLQAVINVCALPADLRAGLDVAPDAPYRQVLLVGHLGPDLWQQLQRLGMSGPDPIDDYSRACVQAWLARHCPGVRHAWLYPGNRPVALQRLGEWLGWQHASPFMVGVSASWGSWFAYRAVVLMDTDFPTTVVRKEASPCASCEARPCVGACPAAALEPSFSLQRCVQYRQEASSLCREQCLARNRCPQGAQYRYSSEQTAYHYRQSLQAIVQWCRRA